MSKAPAEKIRRFRTTEIMVHWAVAVPFIVCYTTALILFFVYNPAPSRLTRPAERSP